MARIRGLHVCAWLVGCALIPGRAAAQVATGTITGTVHDGSGALLPDVRVTASGEYLIGGPQERKSDAAGIYRFDNLPPGSYDLRFERDGFKTSERRGIRIHAAFTATVDAALELGQQAEVVTVEGDSPTVDSRSNLQQIVMSQEILEGVPTGRDPWSVAKIIPGVLITTYDVGGHQSMQQSGMSAHGSLDADKTFAVDGLAVNWPGAAGGATMLYYDQGMFGEVNYQTAAIPAEVQAGGIFINMVTKDAGNRWRGDLRAYYANENTQSDNSQTEELKRLGFTGGNPIERIYDLNFSIGGAIVKDRVWFNGAYRDWGVDRLTLGARNPDGSPALDDNRIYNYSGKLVWQISDAQRLQGSYNHDFKVRYHRRDPPPNFVEDQASLLQDNPADSVQVKYTLTRSGFVFSSGLGGMFGVTDYQYQPGTPAGAIRIEDTVLSTGTVAAPRAERLPNYRVQFDNTVTYRALWAGDHLLKAGVQIAQLRMLDEFRVNGDQHVLFANGAPNSVRIYNTPTSHLSLERMFGLFAQDSWSMSNGLTLNLGARFDLNKGWIPAQSAPAGSFVPARSIDRRDVLDQPRFAWRTGIVYDLGGKGRTALKASFSRYAQQVGLDRVQRVHPFQFANATRAWTDRNGDRVPQESELGASSGFATNLNRYADADGPAWPYSNEITVGLEHQLARDVRVALMYYHRTNREQTGFRNVRVPSSAYTEHTIAVPGAPTGPGGTVTFYNLNPAYFGAAFQEPVWDEQDVLDTDYDGVELTVAKRFSGRWQMLLGLTLGRNEGGNAAFTLPPASVDLNDPNNTRNFFDGIVGLDSRYALRLSGSYVFPGAVTLAGSLISNGGQPYQSTYTITRAVFPTLTRASQVVRLSERGDERLPNVTMLDLRLSRPFRVGDRSVTPQIDVFNVTNASTAVALTTGVGGRYLYPSEILAPRIVRLGVAVEF